VRNDRIKRALRVWPERTTPPERRSQAEWHSRQKILLTLTLTLTLIPLLVALPMNSV
jgi:hypothetical protein